MKLRVIFNPFLVFAVSLAGGLALVWISLDSVRVHARHEAALSVGRAADRLERNINDSFHAAQALATVVQAYGRVEDFETLASGIFAIYLDVDALALAQGGVVTHAYPMNVDKEALGREVAGWSSPGPGDRGGMELRRLDLLGQSSFRQEEDILLGRRALYLTSTTTGAQTFWGHAMVMIRLSVLLQTVDLERLGREGYRYELQAPEGSLGSRRVLAVGQTAVGDPPFQPGVESVSAAVRFPGGEWWLAVEPLRGWPGGFGDAWPRGLLVVFLSAALGGLAFRERRNQDALAEEVALRRREIAERQEAEKNLAQSESRFRSVFQHAAVGMTLTNLEGRYLMVNPFMRDLLEYSEEEMLGRNILEFTHPEDNAKCQDVFQSIASGILPEARFEKRFLTRSGKTVWGLVSASIIRDEAGRPASLVSQVQDVTERRLAQEAFLATKERLTLAFEAANDGLWDWDYPAGRMYFSPRWAGMLGYEVKDLSPQVETVRSLVHPDDQAEFERRLAACLDHSAPGLEIELRLRHRRGGWKWILCRGKVVAWDEAGRPLRLVGTHLDIDERKAMEADLRQAKDDAEKANVAKSEFLANVSHEFRTPLYHVIGLTEIALGAEADQAKRESQEMVLDAARRLLGMVNNIIRMSKMEAGLVPSVSEPFDVGTLLGVVVQACQREAKSKRLVVRAALDEEAPRLMVGDPENIRSVLEQLAFNAVKFTTGGEVVLSARPEGVSAGRMDMHFTVSDTGAGIPQDKLDAVFELFRQADGSLSRRHGGTGLGLRLARRTAEFLGGRLWAESTEGRGTVMHFVTPLRTWEED